MSYGTVCLTQVNDKLDQLVERAGDAGRQQVVLRELLLKCSPQAAAVLICIILKNLKVGGYWERQR